MIASARRDRVILGLVALGVLAAYLAVQRGALDTWDGQAMASVGQNLIKHGSLKECCEGFGSFPNDPGPYSKFGIGYSLLLAPLWLFQLHADPNGAVWLGLANPLLLTATTVVIAKTGLLLGWRRSSAVLAALSFALLTMAPIYSAEFLSEPGVTLGSALLLLGVVVWQRQPARGALLVGIGTAIAIVFRPDSIVLMGPVVLLVVFLQHRHDFGAVFRRRLVQLGVTIGIALAWTLYFNNLRYGNPFRLGYSGPYDPGFSTPLRDGLALLLWSPGKSIFPYSPILLAAIPGFVWLARRQRPLTIVIATMCVLRVAFYARWWTPQGGNSWGPRLLLPLCAALAIPLGETFERRHELRDRARRAATGALVGLAVLSAVVQISSLVVSYRDVFPPIGDMTGVPTALQNATLEARIHRYLWSVGGDNHIAWNLRHIGSRSVSMPLHWFNNGATLFGIAMLFLAAAAVTAALGLASLADRIEQRRDARRAAPMLAD